MKTRFLVVLLLLVGLSACRLDADSGGEPGMEVAATKAALGEKLFFDKNLSFNRSMSCASCHNPDAAFSDNRLNAAGHTRAVSLGADGVSLGDRNTPTVTYAMFAPDFHQGTRARASRHSNFKTYTGALGGQFLDGRASDLQQQAGQPLLNPNEMNMPDKGSVVARLKENPGYLASFNALYGEGVLNNTESAFAALTDSISRFEKTSRFASFDSKYDRYLRGETMLSFKELTGKSLFFSQFANCSICHALHSSGDPVNKFKETFSGYEYHNIGVPANDYVNTKKGVSAPDEGLAATTKDPADAGKFKVPTLRNVAVTGPYMHNGVFRQLKTVIEFYDHFQAGSTHMINPETGHAWKAPEVPVSADDMELLEVGQSLTDDQITSLVCFLRTLTDKRYETLIPQNGINCE